MGEDRGKNCHSRALTPAALIGALAVLSACSSAGERALAPAESGTPSFTSRFSQLFGGGAAQSQPAVAPLTSDQPFEQLDCPPVDIRAGTSTLTVNSPGKDPSAMTLRYQGTISQTARECAWVGGNLAIKVGVQGRIILGPAGTAGQVEVPLRYALVQEGPDPKTLWTKLNKFTVAITDGQASVPFSHVEEELVVPKPAPGIIDAYVVYVGFDTLAASEPRKRPASARRR